MRVHYTQWTHRGLCSIDFFFFFLILKVCDTIRCLDKRGQLFRFVFQRCISLCHDIDLSVDLHKTNKPISELGGGEARFNNRALTPHHLDFFENENKKTTSCGY